VSAWADRQQVPLYVAAIAFGLVIGLTVPGARHLDVAVDPVLGLLLYVTFLQVPVRELVRSLRSGRFLGAVLVTDFVVVPVVVLAAAPVFPAELRAGMLLVLLAPCVDYVIAFSGLAGGSSATLLAATPLLLLGQLPILLWLTGSAGPLLEAFLLLVVLPLGAAWLTQAVSGLRLEATMVPLMIATLFLVVAAHRPAAGVLGAVPFYALFLLVMAPLGALVARAFRLGAADRRAVLFTGATRNSLVVLPLALALPAPAAAVVVTQTLVEVVGMVVLVRTVPRYVRD
jgi:arsenite transporter